MSKLNFKTRGGASPQGKPRVWFCAHAGDYKAFLAPICEEILAKQNCAIYYDEEPAAAFDEESFFADLSQMNLFVMPVTARLLAGGGRALDVEFHYAVEHHIPVLPLMQEQGLEELFNKKCGDLQFLDKNNRDVTAISYDEKLEKYLSSILIGDEMAAKVRAAFDAYIFLSYRKKDRKYAQELMRLIHANEFCRDIAIWYDEFLTPGENFNDSIAEALAKSKLFALAVTPNLVNEKNYVMTVEYPEAVKAGKKILPAELVPTDRAELAVKYENIPKCTDARDSEALASTLANALENIALKENDTDPEHNFFIGLAYLGGIDVEVDHARAKALIEGAAEEGLPEAMEKLVAMYRSGEGVAKDYEKAIEWQMELVSNLKSKFNELETEKNARKYIESMFDLRDFSQELRRDADVKIICQNTLNLAHDLNEKFNKNWSKRYLAFSLEYFGEYIESCKIYKELAKQSGNYTGLNDLSRSYLHLAQINHENKAEY
ncbi:MAG: toll/interleukin-1 receptor domain-containing protein, partial [Clostridia bacterium]|nr:toll/interleukin-1 receptor domain-containing protein [Clostridia bacterium]